jgi:anti-sigma factor RsiW
MTTIDWETLNAYVDRELAPADAARVAAAAARDPSIAARVASLSALKAETSALPPPAVAPPFGVSSAAKTQPRWRPIAIAASAALLIGAGALASLQWPAAGADPLAETVTAERPWLTGERAAQPASGVQVAVEAGASDGLPDLSAADLRLAYLSADPTADGRRGLFAGYLGPHGCRLGLWIGRSDATSALRAVQDVGDVRIRGWATGGVAYALMSRGMDPARLDRFAAVIAEIVGREHKLGDDLRVALQDAARTGGACSG